MRRSVHSNLRLCFLLVLTAPALCFRAPAAPFVQPQEKKTEEIQPKLVSFPSGGLTLEGFLYKPAGDGPFPAVIWNHGSEKRPGWQPYLAKFYTSQGYVFFLPHRHGHGRSPGEYIGDLTEQIRAQEKNRGVVEKKIVQLPELYNQDVVAAVAWLEQESFVDARRIVMSGLSYGGIQTLLTAEKGLGIRAFIPFAPAVMSWANRELHKRLLEAVKNAKAPIFLLQAKNDYSLGPSEVLGKEIEGKGPPNRAKVCPPFGTTHQDGHGGFACGEAGIAIWGGDVLQFLDATAKP